jgi:hypothetical protein
MDKKLTEADVLEAYRAAQRIGRTEFAHELGMSKQSYSAYMRGRLQDLKGLQESAVEYVGSWIGDLAVDLLKVRGAVIPCVCQTALFDNGSCPKHGKPPYEVIGSSKSAVYMVPVSMSVDKVTVPA